MIQTDSQYEETVLSVDTQRPVLVFFSAPWCGEFLTGGVDAAVVVRNVVVVVVVGGGVLASLKFDPSHPILVQNLWSCCVVLFLIRKLGLSSSNILFSVIVFDASPFSLVISL